MVGINIVAVVLAALAAQVIGAIWYSKAVFGKRWMKLLGVSESTKGESLGKLILLASLCSLLTAFVLAFLFNATQTTDLIGAFLITLLLWIGFTAAPIMMNYLYGNRKFDLYYIENGYFLLAMLAMATVLMVLS